MKQWFAENKTRVLALLITIAAWILFATLVPEKIVTIIQAFAFGWYFLGGVALPWVQDKIERSL